MVKKGFLIGAGVGAIVGAVVVSASLVPRVWLPTTARTEIARLASVGLDIVEAAFPSANVPADERGVTDPSGIASASIDSDALTTMACSEMPDAGAWPHSVENDLHSAFGLPELASLKSTWSHGNSDSGVGQRQRDRIVIVRSSHIQPQIGERLIRCELRPSDDPTRSPQAFDRGLRIAPIRMDLKG
ncbi:MAG: hypothetical protein KF678_02160 [Phycisphaeraceae bacterium]|nr:hypothetical protein [Phycisphaeraceae bacterium]